MGAWGSPSTAVPWQGRPIRCTGRRFERRCFLFPTPPRGYAGGGVVCRPCAITDHPRSPRLGGTGQRGTDGLRETTRPAVDDLVDTRHCGRKFEADERGRFG